MDWKLDDVSKFKEEIDLELSLKHKREDKLRYLYDLLRELKDKLTLNPLYEIFSPEPFDVEAINKFFKDFNGFWLKEFGITFRIKVELVLTRIEYYKNTESLIEDVFSRGKLKLRLKILAETDNLPKGKTVPMEYLKKYQQIVKNEKLSKSVKIETIRSLLRRLGYSKSAKNRSS